jgi:hypothetical protein
MAGLEVHLVANAAAQHKQPSVLTVGEREG